MRLLHTSDWHLGRTLHGVDLTEHHAAFGEFLIDLVCAERVDAVLIAGDVYDRAIPPVESVRLLSSILCRLSEHTTVVLTPGNHDSATRLGFGAELLREGVHILADQRRLDRPVTLHGGSGGPDVLVYGLPYLDPDVARHTLVASGEDPLPRSHAAVLGAAMDRVRADFVARLADAQASGAPAPRSVAMAHAFVTGGAGSDSERDIRVGGVDQAPVTVFDQMDYVALGHLHGPQRAGGADAATVVRYSGSPLAYSFSEARQSKSVTLVNLDGSAPPVVRLIPTPVSRRMTDLTGTLEELLGEAGEAYTDDWVRVTVTDPRRPEDLYRLARSRFPHALVIQHLPPRTIESVGGAEITPARDPMEVVTDFITHVGGNPPTPAEVAVLRRAYEQVLAGERSA